MKFNVKTLLSNTALTAFCMLMTSMQNVDAANHVKSGPSPSALYGLWPIIGHDYANTQVNPKEKTISRNNVANLQLSWDYQLPVQAGVLSQPTYADGIIYFGDSLGNLHAVDTTTHQELWMTSFPNQQFFVSPVITDDVIYIASASLFQTGGSSAIAVNRQTGSVLWSVPLYAPGQYAGEYPGNCTVIDDLVIVPLSSFFFDLHFQGRIVAFNKNTGNLVWTVATTSDQFLPNPATGPGASIFSTPAVDRERKMLYIGTGQNFAGYESPLADSLLAIDYTTGKLVWSYKYETNDVWQPFDNFALRPFGTFDHDVSVPPNLFSVYINDKKVDCVGCASKGGQYKIFARDQSNVHGVRPLAALQLDPPSAVGTIQGTPVVVDNTLYIASGAIPDGDRRVTYDSVYIPIISPTDPNLSNLWNLASLKTLALDLEKLVKFGYTDGTIPSEAILWTDVTHGAQARNPLAYANGVLYQTSATGFLRALNPKTGSVLFNVIVDPAVSGPPNIITAGATIADGAVYVGYGYDALGLGGVQGGVKVYALPQQDKK